MAKTLTKLMAILFLSIFLIGPMSASGILQTPNSPILAMSPLRSSITDETSETLNSFYSDDEPGVDEPYLPEDYDITKFLMNNELDYQNVWEPWLTKAAVRCIAVDPTKEFLAVGGGYLYDNEIHLYRWNGYTREYDKVWDSGDQIIQGDVLSIDFGDTDHNDFMEIVCGSADGHVYVFEQEHIYDPFDNMENQFVHVWTSPKLQQVWGVKIADVDKDYQPDIIAGSWDEKIHVYEYTNHSGYPFSKQHWIEYTEKVTIDVGEKIFSVATGDTNYNALPEIIVGTELGRVYIYENNGTILTINGEPWPLTQDNSYRYHWDSGNTSWKPILRIIVDQLDDDKADEIVYISVGQNVFVVNWDKTVGLTGRYLTHQLWEPLDSWELGGLEGLGHYLNHYIDWMSSSNNNLTSGVYIDNQLYNVFVNGTKTPTGIFLTAENISNLHVYYEGTNTIITEPFGKYVWEPQWPKNTSMAIHRKLDPWGEDGVYIDMNGDGVVDDNPIAGIYDINHDPAENYTTFNARDSIASAIVDWGNDGEVMGDGLWAIPGEGLGYDVLLRFHESTAPQLSKISFEVSRGDGLWALIPDKDISLALGSPSPDDDDLWIDIDPILSKEHWAYFRYMRINVTNGGIFKIKGGYAPVLYRPMDTATSITIGSLDLDYYKAYTTGESEGKKIVLGTSDGKIVMFEYNSATKGYDLLWNSYKNDTYTQGTNIWDIVEVKNPGKIPTWLYNESSSSILETPINNPPHLLAGDGEFAGMDHVSLFKTFFEGIFSAYYPELEGIIDLNIPSNDIVVGTSNGKLYIFPSLLNERSEALSLLMFAQVNYNPFYTGMSIIPTFADHIPQPFLPNFPETMYLGWAHEDFLYDPADETKQKAIAGLDFYLFNPGGGIGAYEGKLELAEVEITGLLSRALEKSRTIPEVATGDIDGDGDLDLVLTNGRIYLLENIENAMFRLDQEYFQELNLQTTDKLYTSPELFDFDQDGDLDLSLGISTRPGATYFENVGKRWAPEWKENKWLFTNSWGGLRFNNLTSPTFAIDPRSGKVTHMTTFNNYTKELIRLEAEYNNHNAFVIGTNPIISRLEINLKSGTDSYGNKLENYGYHVFETWNTKPELERWTLTIKTGDMDQDGRGEVIVGDFDNNLYVFEHLTNNTYKRAYRSQDITHKELSTTSPYAWQELEGVSGTFYRTIWDHIEELVVGLDMDNDGFLEMVATAGLSIFVWEQNNDGFVSIDDEYKLIWQADLRQSPWGLLFNYLGITQFTAAAYGGDLDYNGYGEFVLAAGSFLFVFESNGYDSFDENFLVNPWPVRGRYFIPGNPMSSPAVRTLSIEAITIADTDDDKLNEIIIGGVNKTWWGSYNGFVAILENQIGTYAYTWWAPNRLMEENPVFDVMVDNQDYDQYKEIIVGTFKGVVIYENAPGSSRDNNYVERSILTSYVNFPTIKLKQMFDIEAKVQLALRNTDFIELQYDMSDTFGRSQWLQIFKAGQALYFATSPDYGDTWIQHGRVTTDNILIRYRPPIAGWGTFPMTYSYYEYHPSVYQTPNGRVFLAFTGHLDFGIAPDYEGIWLLELKDNAGTLQWENAIFEDIDAFRAAAIFSLGHLLYNPSVWDFHNNTDGLGVAISYINNTNGGIYWQGSFNYAPFYGDRIPNIGKSAVQNNITWPGKVGYRALSHDTIRSVSGDVVIVFSGLSFVEGKVDYDLWIAKSNSTPIWDGTFPYSRATIDGTDELHPSITQTVTPDHALMIIFEAEGYQPSGNLQVTYSKDDGNTWRDPEPVTTTPPFAEYIVYPQYGFSLLVLKEDHNVIVKSLISVGPAITAHCTGGFAYSFMAQYNFFSLVRLTTAQRLSSTVTLGTGYTSSDTDTYTYLSSGDVTAHSGLVTTVGGGLTTGGGTLSYEGTPVGVLTTVDDGGGGSVLVYQTTYNPPPVVNYDPIVTEEESVVVYGGSIVAYGSDAIGTDDPEDDPNTGSGYDDQEGGMLLTMATNFGGSDFHSSTKYPDRGYYNNIFFGMNPTSNFTLFDFMEARAISTGDSDADARREIAIASGNQAFLVEVSRTGGPERALLYYQPWHSDGLATETTDIELYDSNGNGFDEIIVSCVEGNVYSFEIRNTKVPRTNYLFFDWDPVWMEAKYNTILDNVNPSPDKLMDTTDLGSDGVDDLFVATMDSTGSTWYPIVRALNGSTGGEFWAFNLSSEGFSKNSIILTLKSAFINSDPIKDLVFLIHDNDATTTSLYALNGAFGSEIWSVEFDGIDIDGFTEMTFSDLNNDNVSDIIVPFNETVYWINGASGIAPTELFSLTDNSWLAEHVSAGNNTLVVSGRKFNEDNGSVILLNYNGVSWSTVHQFTRNSSKYGLTATLIDVNGDDFEEVLIVESGILFAYETTTGNYSELWNNTFDGAIGNRDNTLKYDFNKDGFQDVMFQIDFNSETRLPTDTIDFEDLSSGNTVDNHYTGLIFSNAGGAWQGWTVGDYGSSSTYIPHSGDMAVTAVEIDSYIIIKDRAARVSAYFSTATGYSYNWSAYDYQGNLLDQVFIEPGRFLQFKELEDSLGRIYRVSIDGLNGISSFFVMDDFSYHQQPLTKLIAMSGLNPADILWEYHLWDTHANDISQGDFDRDGEADDLVFCTEYTGPKHTDAVSVIDGTYGTPFANWQRPIKSVAAGNFGDFGEAAVLDGKGRIYMKTFVRHKPTRAISVAVQMDSSSFKTRGNVIDLAVGDFNADGVDDIVFGDRSRYLMAIEGSTGEIIWKWRFTSSIMRIAVKDINGDTIPDVAVALKSGLLSIIDGEIGRPTIWSNDAYLGPVIVNEMAFVDTNNDGDEELAISMGYRFSAHIGRFVLYNTTLDQTLGHGKIIWQYHQLFAPFTQFEVADFTNDGTLDFAVALYEHSIWILDGTNGNLRNGIIIPVQDFRVGNFTGHSRPEIVVIVRNGTIVAYQNDDWTSNLATEFDKIFLDQIPFRLSHMAIGDFSGDGNDDIVVRSFANGSYCFTLDSDGFHLNWTFEDRSIFYVEEYQVADLNNDTYLDVLTLNYDNIMALSGIPTSPTQVIWASFVPTNLILCTIVGDFNGDGINDVALGTADHWVYILYGKEDYLVEQQGGQGGQITGRIIISKSSSLIKETPTIIVSTYLDKTRMTLKTYIALVMAVGALVTLPCTYVVKKRRFNQ
ncbi:MAG: VCBS repeat-containing protein [Candidatus Heimdallarchaeota archaeon]|nr:MAG: VCBS repeat-containing protein [Candidatus Heimdallarchaeota archaeon]